MHVVQISYPYCVYKSQQKYTVVLIIGFVANGEYNAMRAKGYTRPLSVLKVKAQVRTKYGKIGKRKLLEMITPISKPYMYTVWLAPLIMIIYLQKIQMVP